MFATLFGRVNILEIRPFGESHARQACEYRSSLKIRENRRYTHVGITSVSRRFIVGAGKTEANKRRSRCKMFNGVYLNEMNATRELLRLR